MIEEINELVIKHLCYIPDDNYNGGFPIINLNNKQVLGVHMKNSEYNEYSKGIFLRNPLIEFINEINNKNNNIIYFADNNNKDNNNEIKIKLKTEGKKEEFFLNKNNNIKFFKKGRSNEDNLNILNENNIEVFINNIKYKYKKSFYPIKDGIYDIKLKLNQM